MLPVSDDGGSTAEIVRVLGGPAVGDIRSRCLRLADDSNTEVTPSLPCMNILGLRSTEAMFSGVHTSASILSGQLRTFWTLQPPPQAELTQAG